MKHPRKTKPASKASPTPPTPPAPAFHMPGAQIGQANFINGPAEFTIHSQTINIPPAQKTPPAKPSHPSASQPPVPAASQPKPAAPPTNLSPTPSPPQSFDVFLSHNSQDKPAVRQLADELDRRGIKSWLDERELVPGRPWQEALETIVQTTKAAAVLVASDGLGPWQDREMRGCLSEFVDRGLPVIPVLLPGTPNKPDLPLFLKQFTWVDLRAGFTKAGLDRLQWGITGQKPSTSAASAPSIPPIAGQAAADHAPESSTAQLDPGSRELHPTVWEEVAALLASDSRLSAEVQTALRPKGQQPREALELLGDVVSEAGAVEALSRLRDWLLGQKSVHDPRIFERLVVCLSALGVKDCRWLQASRGRFTTETVRELGFPDEPLAVPGPAWPFTAELVVAALQDRSPCWHQPGELPAKWVGQDYVAIPSTADLADVDDKTAPRLERFVRNFLRLRGLPVTGLFDKDLISLRNHVRRRPARHPYYTEELPQDPLFQQPQLRQLLLILRREPAKDEVLHEPTGLEEVLRQILTKLHAQATSSHLR